MQWLLRTFLLWLLSENAVQQRQAMVAGYACVRRRWNVGVSEFYGMRSHLLSEGVYGGAALVYGTGWHKNFASSRKFLHIEISEQSFSAKALATIAKGYGGAALLATASSVRRLAYRFRSLAAERPYFARRQAILPLQVTAKHSA
ncbi:hypothetical protein NPIL_607631 [Nephila pilipes]|uniref:Uncharacterized protein n=1 Tax=Nephila pilipes TaxID=299642 RepID=A0A8X6UA97_NEPPI|nr:hypothetical protein NPIL_607631 [Nephila pilipes]